MSIGLGLWLKKTGEHATDAASSPTATSTATTTPTKPTSAGPTGSATPAAKLGIVNVAPGAGPAAKAGDRVKVHYTGTLVDGTEFDTSRKRGKPFEFVIGKGSVIKGWDQGILGMKVGGKRRLTIPPGLGYGARGAPGTIPPNATLLFDVELMEIVGN
jgi:FKBP-type peptidyl-prolyl cis-trans isomerase